MQNKIITISRECGSGGHMIGQKLSEKLGIPMYDKEIISMVAKEKGYTEEIIEEKGEHMTGSLLFNLATNLSQANSIISGNNVSLQDEIYFSEVKVIRELADKGPCVIIGRCADDILKKHPNCLNVFIHADMEFKIQRVMERDHLSREAAEKLINKRDKMRASHYRYYTEKEWGSSPNYHLCLDSSRLGIEKCIAVIENIYQTL